MPLFRRRNQLHRTRPPSENPFTEGFGSRLRDELLATELFSNLLEARVIIVDWKDEYNFRRPHSSLGWLAPAVYAANWKQGQPELLDQLT